MSGLNVTEQYIVNLIAPVLLGNPGDYKKLKSFKHTKLVRTAREWIEQSGLTGKFELINYIENMLNQYNGEFTALKNRFELLDYDERANFLKLAEKEAKVHNKYKIIETYGLRLSASNILAYDYQIKMNCYRLLYSADIIDAEELWQYCMPYAQVLQKSYDSWEDFLTASVVGKMFSVNLKYDSELDNERFYFKRFLNRSYSSIHDCPWDTELVI